MDISSIASASVDMHLAQAQQSVSLAVTKKAMDAQEAQGAQIVQQLQSLPSFGHALDVRV